ncbi:probable serine/threonine-protein kinase mkcB [Galendromus occidentalis]|uniref:Probable serine/threonine-protein kinase mkcB n=1 Tax=Galendromus occidentalis TaxID=34638 RepID=A0AAJ7L7V8_9ACAR|nr:probable serine/threonine-protein kinase mkcB [Galendromus occidentalis]
MPPLGATRRAYRHLQPPKERLQRQLQQLHTCLQHHSPIRQNSLNSCLQLQQQQQQRSPNPLASPLSEPPASTAAHPALSSLSSSCNKCAVLSSHENLRSGQGCPASFACARDHKRRREIFNTTSKSSRSVDAGECHCQQQQQLQHHLHHHLLHQNRGMPGARGDSATSVDHLLFNTAACNRNLSELSSLCNQQNPAVRGGGNSRSHGCLDEVLSASHLALGPTQWESWAPFRHPHRSSLSSVAPLVTLQPVPMENDNESTHQQHQQHVTSSTAPPTASSTAITTTPTTSTNNQTATDLAAQSLQSRTDSIEDTKLITTTLTPSSADPLNTSNNIANNFNQCASNHPDNSTDTATPPTGDSSSSTTAMSSLAANNNTSTSHRNTVRFRRAELLETLIDFDITESWTYMDYLI